MLQETAPPSTHSAFSGHHLPFVGFTFSQNCALSDQAELCTLTATGTGSEGGGAQGDELDALAARAYEKRILKLEQENKEISRKLVGKSAISLSRITVCSIHVALINAFEEYLMSVGVFVHKIWMGSASELIPHISIEKLRWQNELHSVFLVLDNAISRIYATKMSNIFNMPLFQGFLF